MAKRTALFLFVLFYLTLAKAQSTDSGRVADTSVRVPVQTDTLVRKAPVRATVKKTADTLVVSFTDSLRFSNTKPAEMGPWPVTWMDLLGAQPYFNLTGRPLHIRSDKYDPPSYDGMFYLLVLMLFFFAIVKLFFTKYLGNLLTLFFRASMRQQQIREQVLQSPFPSLLLNVLFVVAGGMYGAFLLQYYHFANPNRFWLDFMTCTVFLAVLYLLKFLILRCVGWIFNVTKTVETYLFIVFMTNKIIGIFLLPLLVLISFPGSIMMDIGITLSIIMISVFYIYRFAASYTTLHKEIKISGLHFFLYLCAFEIAPLVLIYKVLLTYLEKAY